MSVILVPVLFLAFFLKMYSTLVSVAVVLKHLLNKVDDDNERQVTHRQVRHILVRKRQIFTPISDEGILQAGVFHPTGDFLSRPAAKIRLDQSGSETPLEPLEPNI